MAVVEAYVYPAYPHYSVVHSERNGANFAYSINSAPYAVVHPHYDPLYAAKQVVAPGLSHGYAFSHPAAVAYSHYPVGVYPVATETSVKPTVQVAKPAEVTADAIIVESA